MRKIITFVVLVKLTLFVFLFSESTFAQTNNWPQFRGVNCSGIADNDAKPPIEFGEDNIIWKIKTPIGHSSPCIWGNNIFITGFIEEKNELQLICIDRTTGGQNWSQTVHPDTIEKFHPISNPAVTTPVTDGDIVCVYFGSYGLLCYDFQGNLKWEFITPVGGGSEGTATSPILVGDHVIFTIPYGKDPSILSLHRTTGEILWKTPLPQISAYGASNHSTPIVWGEQVILHRMGEIVAHSIHNGKRLWWISAPTKGNSTPIIDKNTLFVCTWNNFGESEMRIDLADFQSYIKNYDKNNDGLISLLEIPENLLVATRPEISEMNYANFPVRFAFQFIDKNKDNYADKNEWRDGRELFASLYENHGILAIQEGGTGDITLSNILWKVKDKVPEVPSPVYFDEKVYMVKNGGIITCMDAKTGQIIYQDRLGSSGAYIASPIVAGNMIYLPSTKGVITVISGGDKLEILSRNKLGEKIFATPAVIGNNLYVRTEDHFYAFK